MTKESKRNVVDFIIELRYVRGRVDNILRFISDVQSDTYKKEWEIGAMTEEECLYEDRKRVADSLMIIYDEIGTVLDSLQGSLEGVER